MEPMNFIVFDTTGSVLRIAGSIDGKDFNKDIKNNFKHIENLFPVLDEAFFQINEDKNKIKYVGVCSGPGSFTGIRIGISAAVAAAYSLGIKTFSFSVFDVYGFLLSAEKDSLIVPVIDAKKNKFYCAFMKNNETYKMCDYSLSEILDEIKKENNKNIIFTGKDFNLIKEKMNFPYQYLYNSDYSSSDLLHYSKYVFENKMEFSEPKPIYLRKSEAEIVLLEKNKI